MKSERCTPKVNDGAAGLWLGIWYPSEDSAAAEVLLYSGLALDVFAVDGRARIEYLGAAPARIAVAEPADAIPGAVSGP